MNEVRDFLMIFALGGLAVIAAGTFLAKVGAPVWDAVRRFAGVPRIQQAVVVALVVALVHYGATKGFVTRFYFAGGIKQNVLQQSWASNNTVVVHWQRDTAGGVFVPADAAVYIDARQGTNAWLNVAETTVGAWTWTGTVQNATNYDYQIWAYYIPPEPVHTNGVWIYKTLKDRKNCNALPLRARIEVNGKAIATPREKRKDENND